MQGHRIGYVRVSSLDQTPERQLEHVHVGKMLTDQAPWKDTQRPQLDSVREGDTVVELSKGRPPGTQPGRSAPAGAGLTQRGVRIGRTLFALDRTQNVERRRRVQIEECAGPRRVLEPAR